MLNAFRLFLIFETDVSLKLFESVKHFRADVPTIVELGNPSMKSEHWEQIYKIMGLDSEVIITMDFSLSKLIENGIMDFKKEISEISGTGKVYFKRRRACNRVYGKHCS